MSSAFECTCGAATCRGTIRGFKHLTPQQRRRALEAEAQVPVLSAYILLRSASSQDPQPVVHDKGPSDL